MTRVAVPDRSAGSLGATLTNTRAPVSNEFSAVNLEKIKDAVIAQAEAINASPATHAVAANPTTGDDSNDGYIEGSIWVNTTTNTYFTCVDASVGAAIWVDLSAMLAALSGVITIGLLDTPGTSLEFRGGITSADFEVGGILHTTGGLDGENVEATHFADPTAVDSLMTLGYLATALAALTGTIDLGATTATTNLRGTTNVGSTSGKVTSVGKMSDGQYGLVIDATGQVTLRNNADLTDVPIVVAGAGESISGTLSVTGISYLTTTFIAKALALQGILSPSSIGANQNDYAPTGYADANILRLTSSAAYKITGMLPVYAGKVLPVVNIGSYPIELTREDSGSTAAYRFAEGAIVGPGHCVCLLYDNTTQRWRIIGNAQRSQKIANGGTKITASTYTIKPEDEIILVDTTSNAVALTAAALDGIPRLIQKVAGGTNGITLVRTGSEKINSVAATYTLPGSDVAFSAATPQAWTAYDDYTDRWIA